MSPGEQQRQAILAEIAALGPVLPGSITERTTRCQTGSCHCRADPPVLHGPYPTWTHRAGGRQLTRTLTPEQASQLRPLIDADRRLRQLVRELEALTLTAIQNPSPAASKPGPRPAKAGIHTPQTANPAWSASSVVNPQLRG